MTNPHEHVCHNYCWHYNELAHFPEPMNYVTVPDIVYRQTETLLVIIVSWWSAVYHIVCNKPVDNIPRLFLFYYHDLLCRVNLFEDISVPLLHQHTLILWICNTNLTNSIALTKRMTDRQGCCNVTGIVQSVLWACEVYGSALKYTLTG